MSDFSTTDRTITGFYDSRGEADRAVENLLAAGIPRSAISLVAGSEGTTAADRGEGDFGFWDALKDLFMPDEDRYTYAEGLRRGGYVVTVRTTASTVDSASDILEEYGSVDLGERETAWRSEGWSGYEPDAFAARRTAANTTAAASGRTPAMKAGASEEVIPVMEEQLRVGKRDVSHGRVRVRSYVVETPVTERVDLRQEHVHVERRPVDRAATGDERLFQDRTIEVEERAEEAVVAKEARVKEELVIKKDVEHRTDTVADSVRRTEVEVDDDRGAELDRTTTTDFTTKKVAGTGRF